MIPSEPVFVPSPGDGREDDGVVLAVVNVNSDDSSFLLILDAETFEERARVLTPVTINHGIHSVFIPPRETQEATMVRY